MCLVLLKSPQLGFDSIGIKNVKLKFHANHICNTRECADICFLRSDSDASVSFHLKSMDLKIESVRTIRQEKVLCFVVCTANAFIGCVDKIKIE